MDTRQEPCRFSLENAQVQESKRRFEANRSRGRPGTRGRLSFDQLLLQYRQLVSSPETYSFTSIGKADGVTRTAAWHKYRTYFECILGASPRQIHEARCAAALERTGAQHVGVFEALKLRSYQYGFDITRLRQKTGRPWRVTRFLADEALCALTCIRVSSVMSSSSSRCYATVVPTRALLKEVVYVVVYLDAPAFPQCFLVVPAWHLYDTYFKESPGRTRVSWRIGPQGARRYERSTPSVNGWDYFEDWGQLYPID